MFDLTKEIRFESAMQKKYAVARTILHLFFLIAVLFVLYRILFPIVPLDFAMDSPDASKNTLVSPRISQTGEFPPKKSVTANEELSFNANPIGQFSEASISFTLAKNSADIENASVKIRKSYQAFFYPIGNQVGFKDGTLVSTPDGRYYIVSDGALRRFSNTDIILSLGYPKSAFADISTEDLILNKPGEEISDANNYPNDTLFVIDENYYQLEKQQLFPFISTRAFLSQFDVTYAIRKNKDFLARYPIAETSLGFADGTLASSADSVFILSEGKSYPVENEVTFSDMGFDWNEVISATSDELSAYQKQKQFTHDDPHPNGIIFYDQETNVHYLIEDGKRRPINSASVAKTYSKQKAILADSAKATKESSCTLKKKTLSSNVYTCNVSIENLSPLIGNDYQITSSFPATITINNINTTFSTPLTFDSLRNSLSIIKNKLRNR